MRKNEGKYHIYFQNRQHCQTGEINYWEKKAYIRHF